jgi:hypothetical protein
MNKENIWGLVTGLLLGAGVFGHALRIVILDNSSFTDRHTVAIAAVVMYSIASILTFFKHKAGLYIAIIGPLMGITAVTFSPKAQIDLFQLVLGVPQFLAIFLSVYLLINLKSANH